MVRLHDTDADALNLVAHELRVPLVALVAFLEQLARAEEMPGETRIAYARGAQELGRKMLHRLAEIQAVVRADTGRLEVARKPCTVGVVLGEAMDELPPESRSAIALEGDAIAFGDAEMMRQALVAVLAAMAGEEGEAATVQTAVEHDRAVITVTRKRALPAADLDRMLLPFEPLGVARWLVEAQDGGMELHSSAATGTRVTFRMPLAFQANPLLAMSVRPPRLVLAVDDDPATIDLYERALAPQGFRVVGTSRGRLDLAISETRPDVMLVGGMSFDPTVHPSIPAVAIARPSISPASKAMLEERCNTVFDKTAERASFSAELGAALHAAIPTRMPTTKRS